MRRADTPHDAIVHRKRWNGSRLRYLCFGYSFLKCMSCHFAHNLLKTRSTFKRGDQEFQVPCQEKRKKETHPNGCAREFLQSGNRCFLAFRNSKRLPAPVAWSPCVAIVDCFGGSLLCGVSLYQNDTPCRFGSLTQRAPLVGRITRRERGVSPISL